MRSRHRLRSGPARCVPVNEPLRTRSTTHRVAPSSTSWTITVRPKPDGAKTSLRAPAIAGSQRLRTRPAVAALHGPGRSSPRRTPIASMHPTVPPTANSSMPSATRSTYGHGSGSCDPRRLHRVGQRSDPPMHGHGSRTGRVDRHIRSWHKRPLGVNGVVLTPRSGPEFLGLSSRHATDPFAGSPDTKAPLLMDERLRCSLPLIPTCRTRIPSTGRRSGHRDW